MTFLLNILAFLGRLPLLSKLAAILGSFSGVAAFITPITTAIGAMLAPIFDGLGRFLVAAFTSLGQGIKISLSNIGAFWVIYPVVFLSGAWYFGVLDPMGGHKAKKELQAVTRENVELRRKTGATPRQAETRKKKFKDDPVDWIGRSFGVTP